MPNIAILYESDAAHPMILREDHIDMIRKHDPDGEVIVCGTEEELIASGFDAEVLFAWGRLTPEKYCSSCSNLRWIQSISAGAEGLMKLSCAKPPMMISKMSGVHGKPMSESCLAYILCFLHRLPLLREHQRDHRWEKPADPGPDECFEKTVSIIGVGDIGSEIAKKCSFMGMKVIGCRRTPRPMEFVDEMYGTGELDKVLGMSDFVVCLVPESPSAKHMFGEHEFSAMKKSAVFINIGRGSVVDTEALIKALEEGRIYGAALDAFEKEPLSEDSPLWDMTNVIITPHCCADSPYYFDRAVPVICENLDRYISGKEILHRVL